MSQLPAGWEEIAIGEVAEVNPRPSVEAPSDDTHISFVPMAACEAETGRLDASGSRQYGELRKKSYRHFEEGDVVVAKITPSMENGKAALGKNLLGGQAFGTTEFHVLRPSARIDARYLLHFVLQPRFRADAARHMTGTAGQLRVPAEFLRQAPISLPPLDEQQRIVEAIDEQFSRLDAGVGSLQRAKRNLDGLRASILAAAANGKLDTPTSEFRGDAEHWRPTTLGELLISIEAGTSFRALTRPAAEEEWGVIKVSAMTWGSFREGENKALPAGIRFDPAFEIAEGDLLLSRANTSEYVGATVLVPPTRPRLLLSDKSMRLHVREGVNKRWLWYTLLAPPLRSQMSAVATGTSDSMRNISQAKVRRLSIKVPPLDIQNAFVIEIDRRLSVIDALGLAVKNALTCSNTLRSSVFRAAFSGDLQEARK